MKVLRLLWTSRYYGIIVISILFSSLLLTSQATGEKLLQGIPLQWKLTAKPGKFGVVELTGLEKVKIQVAKFTDERKNKELIAENREDAAKILPVTTKDSVAEFCRAGVKKVLEQIGLNVVESGGNAVLSAEIKSFFVIETNVYKADVSLKVKLQDKSGKTLWTGITSGEATRFGRSYKDENYYEALSDSLTQAVYKLLQANTFRQALISAGS